MNGLFRGRGIAFRGCAGAGWLVLFGWFAHTGWLQTWVSCAGRNGMLGVCICRWITLYRLRLSATSRVRSKASKAAQAGTL